MKKINKIDLTKSQEPIEKLFKEQLELSGMSVMSLLQLGSKTLLKEAIASEITQYLGRDFYQHSSLEQVNKGQRNGYRKTILDTPIGQVEYERPRLAGAPDFKSQFHKPYMKRPEEFSSAIAEMYVNGVSTRKVKGALKAIAGEKVRLSKSTVSRISKRLKEEFKIWRKRDLSKLEVAYLFVDAIRVGMRMGEQGKDCILVAYAILTNGQFEPISIGLGHSESKRAWGSFLSDLKQRGLKDPLLCISDGNAGVIEALDNNFLTSYRQRCVKHKIENILDVIPKEKQKEVRGKLSSIFYGATSLEQAKLFIRGFKKQYSKIYPSAISRMETDLDQCLSFYLFPVKHWKRIRTSNKLERMNLEIRRRLDVIGRHPCEEGCLALVYQISKRYSYGQQNVMANDLEKMLWTKLRNQKIEMIEQLELDLYAA